MSKMKKNYNEAIVDNGYHILCQENIQTLQSTETLP